MYFQSRSSDFSIGSSAWKISEWYVFFCSVFYCIQSKCRKILNRKNSEFGHIGPYFEVEEEKAMPSLQFFFNPLHTQQIPIKDFFSKSDQIRRNLQIWSHLLKKSLLKTSFFVQWSFLNFDTVDTQFQLNFIWKMLENSVVSNYEEFYESIILYKAWWIHDGVPKESKYWVLLRFLFSRFQTEYQNFRLNLRIQSVKRENTEQKKSVFVKYLYSKWIEHQISRALTSTLF